MVKAASWEARIGRRVRLRDLHVLFAVVESGSMAKAAASARGHSVRHFANDRGLGACARCPPFGPQPARGPSFVYGNALLRHGKAAFDDLRQGIQEIEFLADPGAGEIRIGAPESVSSAILPAIIRPFTKEHPRALLDVDPTTVTTALPKLRSQPRPCHGTRRYHAEDIHLASDLKVEVLFNDELVVVADAHSQWARRRKIDLVELADARWILASSGFSNVLLAEAFRARGLDLPKISLKTFSIHIRTNLIAGTSFVTTLPKSVLNYYADRLPLKALPVALPARPWPLLVVTLKDRSVSPWSSDLSIAPAKSRNRCPIGRLFARHHQPTRELISKQTSSPRSASGH